jgi:hypothetical protein
MTICESPWPSTLRRDAHSPRAESAAGRAGPRRFRHPAPATCCWFASQRWRLSASILAPSGARHTTCRRRSSPATTVSSPVCISGSCSREQVVRYMTSRAANSQPWPRDRGTEGSPASTADPRAVRPAVSASSLSCSSRRRRCAGWRGPARLSMRWGDLEPHGPARRATSVACAPTLSQRDTAAWRRW